MFGDRKDLSNLEVRHCLFNYDCTGEDMMLSTFHQQYLLFIIFVARMMEESSLVFIVNAGKKWSSSEYVANPLSDTSGNLRGETQTHLH